MDTAERPRMKIRNSAAVGINYDCMGDPLYQNNKIYF
jgi:hypothetical protein